MLELLAWGRSTGITQIAGGPHATHAPEETIPHVDALVTGDGAQCLAAPGEIYAVYLRRGGQVKLDLGQSGGAFDVMWYNPRLGGRLVPGSVRTVAGPGSVALGAPPREADQDWAILIRSQQE